MFVWNILESDARSGEVRLSVSWFNLRIFDMNSDDEKSTYVQKKLIQVP
jgi:hypothetical protein